MHYSARPQIKPRFWLLEIRIRQLEMAKSEVWTMLKQAFSEYPILWNILGGGILAVVKRQYTEETHF